MIVEHFINICIPNMPKEDQINPPFNKYLKDYILSYKVDVNNMYYVIKDNINITDLYNKLCDCIKNGSWSVNMWILDKNINTCRPITSIITNIPKMPDNISYIPIIYNTDIIHMLSSEERLINIQNMLLYYNVDIEINKDIIQQNVYVNHTPMVIEISINTLNIDSTIINYIINKHFLSIYSHNKVYYITNKYNSTIEDIKLMEFSINSRILDYHIMINSDLEIPLNKYIDKNKNKILNRYMGTIYEEGLGVYNIYKNITNNIINLEYFMLCYRISNCSSIVQEDPPLENIMNKIILSKNNMNFEYDYLFTLSQYIYRLNILIKTNQVYTPKKDPFGFRRISNQIFNIIISHNISLKDEQFGECITFLYHRLDLLLENKIIKNISLDLCTKLNNIDFSINPSLMARIKKLIKNINIDLNNTHMITLIESHDLYIKSQNINIHNINNFLESINIFIDTNNIINNQYNTYLIYFIYNNICKFINLI